MEMPGRRSNYTLLSQFPDDQNQHQQPQQSKFTAVSGGGVPSSYYESHSGEMNNKLRSDRVFDWDLIDHRMIQPPHNRIGSATPAPLSNVLQRHSSGSSFGDSSISGDCFAPPLSNPEVAAAFGNYNGSGGELRVNSVADGGGGGGCSSFSKSWAQQMEESYQLQLALALRLSSEATCGDDPNFLDSDNTSSRSSAPAEVVSHRFWVNGSISYFDKVPDGFYLIHGMDPYVWTVCNELQENGRIPSIESLKSVDPSLGSSAVVILVDRHNDPSLKDLQNHIQNVSSSCITTKEVVELLAKLVCNKMGGVASSGEDELLNIWKERSDAFKNHFGSIVLPIGSLSIGLCRHRALLFKVLADIVGLPCRIAKGCKYCTRSEASSCLVRFDVEREYLVDLIGKPGCLCEPDSMLNGPSTISISSPLHLPQIRQVEPAVDFRSLAKQYFSDCLSLDLVFYDHSAATDADAHETIYAIQRNSGPNSSNQDSQTVVTASDPIMETANDMRFFEAGQLVPTGPSRELNFDVEDLDIPWSDLVLREKIGAGSFGTVHRAEWNGCDVAVKILMEQDFHAERFNEFLREVAIMKRLRHPNIVLFMGAVTRPPNLSIVTEYLSRGSLYRLLHKPGAREALDERRRLSMAYDVAKGMNYLHKHNPPIVHRDLKSPNLLVDRKYTVKVGDFGLSRLKANTFISSKSAAGTPEWMAPEVLLAEPSNEKSDVYSFGVILWELATLQQPWSHLSPEQVVGAVGFKGKRPEIPRDLNPRVAAIIEACWANDPRQRPSFSTVMDLLKPLIKAPLMPQ